MKQVTVSGRHEWYVNGQTMEPGEAARELGIAPATLRKWARAGAVRYVTVDRGSDMQFIYNSSDVQFLEEKLSGLRYPTLPILRTMRLLRFPAEDGVSGNSETNQPSPVALGKAVELVSAAYREGMTKAGMLQGKINEVDAYASAILEAVLNQEDDDCAS